MYVNVGQKVKIGSKLVNMDIAKIKKANLEPTVITLVTNAKEKAVDFELNTAGEDLLEGKIVGNIKVNKE
jgi:phosphotransferase system IIA component